MGWYQTNLVEKLRLHSSAIRYFDAVRRAGSIRGGARLLNVASSAVNRQILKLEEELEAPLFERLSGGLKLTDAGELLARHVTTVLQDASRLEDELNMVKGGSRGELSIVAGEMVSKNFLPTVIENMLREHPYVRLQVQTAVSNLIAPSLANGETDVGLAFAVSVSPAIEPVAVGRFPLGAVMRTDHPLAARRSLTLSDAVDYPWILSNNILAIRAMLEPAIRRLGRSAPWVVEATSFELMKNLAMRGIGISFQSVFGLEGDLEANRLVHIPLLDGGPIYTDLGIFIRKGRALPATTRAFIDIAADELAKREKTEKTRVMPKRQRSVR